MTSVDTSSYSCKELVDYLEVHGTDREKQLIERYGELQDQIESLEEDNHGYSIEFDLCEDRIADLEFEKGELQDDIADLKEQLKAK